MFTVAKPIYLKNLEKENNVTSFYAANFDCDGENATLTIAGHSAYRVSVNGDFACFGPSKTVDRFAKFDIVDISKYVSYGLNQIVIECATYEESDTPNFIQAEVFADGKVVAATSYNFIGFLDVERLESVGNTEKYNISGSSMIQTSVQQISSTPILVKRDVPYPTYKTVNPVKNLKYPIDVNDKIEISFGSKYCGFINIAYKTDKTTEFVVENELGETLMEIKSIDGEFQRESFNPHKTEKIIIKIKKGCLELYDVYIKEYCYYSGKTPANISSENTSEDYINYRKFLSEYNDYNFKTVEYNQNLLDFQIKEKAYTDSNKITESILNIPLYAPATNIEDTLYYTILEKTLNDNPEIKKLKYKRILNTKK